MKRNNLILMITFLIMAWISIAVAEDNNTAILKEELGVLNLFHPEKDIKKNIASKDFRFACICGYACFAPGVDGSNSELTDKYGMKCIKGTNDVVESKEHGKLMQIARDYAMKYNLQLLDILKTKNFNKSLKRK